MIKLALPDIGEEELAEVKKVFDSKYLVQGDKVEEFENLVKKYLNVKHVIAVTSGTAALHLALVSLNVKSDDEVIVPDFTFPATSNVVELVGASTKFVDIKLESFCIDVDQIEKNITENTKAIIPVHEFGQPTDMDKIMSLAKKYNLKVIEDAACALGAEYKGKMIGTIGDIGCFSLHPRKAITTGEGGLVVTNNDELAEKIKILRNHGLSYVNGKPEFVMAGFNYRMTNIQGAIGVAQMKKLRHINEKRAEIAREYDKILKDVEGITIPEEKNYGKHVWQSYHILLDKEIDRDLLIKKLKEKGIETNFGAYAVHMQPYYKEKYKYDDINYKNAINAYQQGIVLPLHTGLSKDNLIYIRNTIEVLVNE
jgi:dTDP-4-amino-4,6-dideoxygalactose transaminase